MQPVRVGVLGLGTVGGGTVNVLARNAGEIERRAGRAIRVVAGAARNIERARSCSVEGLFLSSDPLEVVEHNDVDVVVETLGGVKLTLPVVLRAIELGKHVVTANKALIALHGNEIFAAAQASGVMVAFEAAVAGGIPIIKAVREGLAGNRIDGVAGIINGTANYILTEMRDKGRDFPDVLAEAQALGYAEADPTFDIEGIDAAHKLCILASIAFGIPLQFDRLHVEGIASIAREDVAYAAEFGYRIKHLGIARRVAEGFELRVHPTLIPERRLIANVDGVMNAVLVHGDAVGPAMFYGAGAGADATASAVVADLVDVVRAMTTDPENRVPHLAFQPGLLSDAPIVPMSEVRTAYYLRLRARDEPGVLADIARILANYGVSVDALLQREADDERREATLIVLTHRVREGAMDAACHDLLALPSLVSPLQRIRVESLGRSVGD
ncbi:MAG: homoserine dehydrogenase [Thioalkalivibrionaceae bacterium]